MDKLGIAGIPAPEPTLEDKIKRHLANVPDDATLKDTYVDASDRQRVRRRALIAATLGAVFEHQSQVVFDKEDKVKVGIKPDVFSELADARRDFLHDTKRLDHGAAADVLLVPATKEALPEEITASKPTLFRRWLVIYWLAVGELWTLKDAPHFPSKRDVFKEAERFTGKKVSSLESELSRIRGGSRFSKLECDFFEELLCMARTSAKGDGNRTALNLLLPAVRALSIANAHLN
jgi:hypothetical protein